MCALRRAPVVAGMIVFAGVVAAGLGLAACTALLGDFSVGPAPQEGAAGPQQDAASTDDSACPTGLCAIALGANGHHTCAAMSDGTLRCWGDDSHGECGPNADGGRTPVVVTGIGPVQYPRLAQTATCALLVDGSVWCWGDNSRGTLGVADAAGFAPDGAAVDSPTPLQVMGPGTAASLGVGGFHACAVTTATPAQLMCWGLNGAGQAGVPDTSAVFTPTVVASAADVVRVGLGAYATCFVRSAAPLGECFGENVYGELGRGAPADAGASDASAGTDDASHPLPAAVALGSWGPLSNFAHSTGYHMGLTLQSGQVATWGADNDGQLGLGDDSGASRATPALLPSFDDVTQMSFTQYGSCALRADGTVWCWGSTAYGETGSSANQGSVQPTPAQVPGLSQVMELTAGLDHVCALIDGGTVECWGWNADGELGRATTAAFDPNPAPVSF